MTDKQIIIDGVNITNCIHRATNKLCGDIDPYCRCYTGSCKDINNCYYKQLKRAEAQCEDMFVKHTDLEMKYNKKEQEYERLKKQNDILLGQLVIIDDEDVTVEISQSQFEEYDQLKAENEELKNAVMLKCPQCGEVYLNPIGAKLYETLAEIKEIAKYELNNLTESAINGGRYVEILQKINEVLDENI